MRVFDVEDRHHALDLWEKVCGTGEVLEDQAPLLLMPEGYTFLEDKQELLLEMAKLFRINEMVRSCPSNQLQPLEAISLENIESHDIIENLCAWHA